MDDQRIGATFRAIRIRKGLRQSDVGQLAGVSRWVVARIERGRLREVSLLAFRRVADALGAYIEIRVRWEGANLDRLMNSRHSALHEVVARHLTTLDGWAISPEVSYSIYGERGVIDILAWHPATRALLIIELKTQIVDVNDLLASMDRRRRLAPQISRPRGMDPASVSAWVIVAEGPTNRRVVGRHSTVLRSAFPRDGRTIRPWLARPVGSIAALSFLSMERGTHIKPGRGGPCRVHKQRSRRDPALHERRSARRSLEPGAETESQLANVRGMLE